MTCFLVVAAVGLVALSCGGHVPEKYHMKWLNIMLWGASGALLVEHVWHGEIVPWFPFITAMGSAADTSAMLYEMAVVGVPMALTVVALWAGLVALANRQAAPPLPANAA